MPANCDPNNPGSWFAQAAADSRWDTTPTSATPVRDEWCAGIATEQQCYNVITQICNTGTAQERQQACPDGSTATVDRARVEFGRSPLPPPPVEAGTNPGTGPAPASNVDLNNLGNNPALDVSIANPFIINGNPVTTVEGVILAILQMLIVIVTPLIALAIILGGLKYVTARGNPQQISEAHKMITYAIIGAVLVLGAITLSEVLRSTIAAFRVAP